MKNTHEIYQSSGLFKIEATVNEIYRGIMSVSLRNSMPKPLSMVNDRLAKNPNYSKPVGLWVQHMGQDPIALLPNSVVALWNSDSLQAQQLKQHWPTYQDFFTAVAAESMSFTKSLNAQRVKDSETESKVTTAIIDNIERKSKSYQLLSNWNNVCENISVADNEFIFSHLFKDNRDNLYWKFSNNKIQMIPMAESSSFTRISEDNLFWTLFMKDNAKKIYEYSKRIIDVAYEIQQEKSFDSEDASVISTIEERLENIVPHVIMRCISVEVTFKKIGSGRNGDWQFDGFNLAMSSPNKSMDRNNWCLMLQKNLLSFVDISDVNILAQWATTTENKEAIHTFDDSWLSYANKVTKMPKLPSAFGEFFANKFSNPVMDLLRIATFVTSVIDTNNFSRQVLILSGAGKDGKGVFTKVLENIFSDACVTLQENAFSPESRFGLECAVNSRLMILQDVSKPTAVIESPYFKSVTGCDTIQIDRKFKSTIEWKVRGTKMIIVTNKPVWLNDMYAVSRCLPVYVNKNYDTKTIKGVFELTTELLAEKNQFVQWCFDYVNYFKQLKNSKDELWPFSTNNGLTILSDASFADWKKGEIELDQKTEDDLVRNAFDSEGPINQFEEMFKVNFYKDAASDDEVYFEDVFKLLFSLNPDEKQKRSDIGRIIATAAGEKRFPILKILGWSDASNVLNSKTYGTFLKWLCNRDGITITRTHGTFYIKGIEPRNLSPEVELAGFTKNNDANSDKEVSKWSLV